MGGGAATTGTAAGRSFVARFASDETTSLTAGSNSGASSRPTPNAAVQKIQRDRARSDRDSKSRMAHPSTE